MTIVIVKSRGLTLGEVIVAIGVFAAMTLTLLALFTQLMNFTTKNNLLNFGTLYADRLLEQTIRSRNSTGPAFSASREGEESVVTQGDDKVTKFVYRVEAEKLEDADPGERWLLTVKVEWWQDAPGGEAVRTGFGKLSTQNQRLVYVK
jgi:hypothetical protein